MSQPALTSAVFYILLALALQDRHGYGIMQQVEIDSLGKIAMGPGTLYGSIKRMLADQLIEECAEQVDLTVDNQRRRYYRLTKQGRQQLVNELQRYQDITAVAIERNLLPNL